MMARDARADGNAVPPFVPLHQRFFDAIDGGADLGRPAVQTRDRAYTYGAFLDRVERIAGSLSVHGVRSGDRVALVAERTFDAVAAIYAVLALGAVYVPIEPALPAERARYQCRIAGCRWLLTDCPCHPASGEVPTPALDLATMTGPRLRCPVVAVAEGDLAFILFTSGSTGRPKGVMVDHGSSGRLIGWALRRFSPSELRLVLASTSFAFDVSIFELFAALACGGCLGLGESVVSLIDLPFRDQITFVSSVPSALAAILVADAVPTRVRTVALAGEALHGGLVRSLYERGVERVYNLYGPTEATVFCTEHLVARDGDAHVPIGRPMPGVEVEILDETMRAVRPGDPGELYVGGPGLAQGYVGRPDLTAERFTTRATGPHRGRRLYRTGDRVRAAEDGLHYVGRVDHQVKWRGYRIELGEIESVIGSVTGVAHASVHLMGPRGSSAHTGEVLTAYVVPAAVAAEDLRARILSLSARMLPSYMRPQHLVVLDALPVTLNGKVDVARLPSPTSASSFPHDYALAPQTQFNSQLPRESKG